jgi:hypothetical protein
MTDEMNNSEAFVPEDENPVEPSVQPEAEAAVETADLGETDDWDEEVGSFIAETGAADLPDPNSVVTIRTSGGGDRYVPVTQPTSVKDVIAQSGLYFGGAVQYWLNGAQVNQDTLVPGGSTLSVIGSVKGG